MLNATLREPLNSRNYTNLRIKLLSLRKKNHLTQKELVKKLSISLSFVSKVELGERRFDILEIKKISKSSKLFNSSIFIRT